jgi:hypothetical protein
LLRGATLIRSFHIALEADRVLITGDAMQSVKVDADGFVKQLLNLPQARSIDFLQIAAAVYAIDRISKRSFTGSNEYGHRSFRLEFEVRAFEFWSQPGIADSLARILGYLIRFQNCKYATAVKCYKHLGGKLSDNR